MAEVQLPSSIRDVRGLAFEALIARLGGIPTDAATVSNLATLPNAALPTIAWGWRLLGALWDALPDALTRRDFLKHAYELTALRGTPYAVRKALSYLGWTATILESQFALKYNGVAKYDGAYYYGTGFGKWWEFGVELAAAGKAYSAADHALVKQIATLFARKASRLQRVVLHIEDIVTAGGGLPAFVGATRLAAIGLSADGVTFPIVRAFRRFTHAGTAGAIDWRVFAIDGPLTFSFIALLRADGTVYAQIPCPARLKDSDMEAYGHWSITW